MHKRFYALHVIKPYGCDLAHHVSSTPKNRSFSIKSEIVTLKEKYARQSTIYFVAMNCVRLTCYSQGEKKQLNTSNAWKSHHASFS